MKEIYKLIFKRQNSVIMLFILFGGLTLKAQNSYTVSTFAGSMTNIIGSTTVWDGSVTDYDDEYSLSLPLGFTFKYFGSDFTSVYASTNGWISFYAPSNSVYTNVNIPDGGTPYGVIAPFWDDFEVKAQGNTDKVSYITTGSAPNRIFTIEYYSITRYNTSEYTDFQVKLYETSNIIEFHYGTNSLTTGSASIGIENYGGSIGYCGPNCGSANTTIPSNNYRFAPKGYWLGATSSAWNTASNWVDGNVPSSTDDVIIPSNYINAPDVNISNAVCSSISLASGKTLTISSGNILTVSGTSDINGTLTGAGTFDANGYFDANGGTISMSGRLKLGYIVNSLGDLSSSSGTIEYDGVGAVELANETGSETAEYGNSQTTLNDPFWNNVTSDDSDDWYGESDATLSDDTGPSAPQSGDDYIYVETSSGYCYSSGNSAILLSDAITQAGVQISFYYNAYGSAIDDLVLEYSTNGGASWMSAWSISDLNSSAWVAVNVDLSAYAVTHLRFKYTRTSTDYTSDIALDNINVTYQDDVSILIDDYYNLEIDCDASNSGTLNIDGDLTLSSGSTLDKGSTTLSIAGSYINNGGTFNSTGGYLTFDGTGSETCAAFSSSSTALKIEKTSGGSLITTGDSDFDIVYINSGTYLIDGETITSDSYVYLQGGILKITSGLFYNNTTSIDNLFQLSAGTLDIDGGEVRIGNLTSTSLPDIDMTGGDLDISDGTLNICDALNSSSGTITQTGGNINLGAYTGITNHSTAAKFTKTIGSLNLTAGTITVKSQFPDVSSYAIQISSGVTLNSNANHTIVLDPSGEDMYLDLNGNTLGAMTINNSGLYSVFAKDNFVLKGDLTINTNGKLESYLNNGDITLNGGSFINNGYFNLNSSDIAFIGGNDVTCGSIISNGAGTLVMNKTSSSNLLNLDNDLELKGLILTSGRIIPSTNELTIRVSSPGSPSSHVVGNVNLNVSSYTYGSIEVPTGDGSVYRPVFIQPEGSGATTYAIKYNNTAHSSVNWGVYSSVAPVGAGVHHIAGGYWWDVNRISGSIRAKVGFNWNVGVNPSQLDNVEVVADMLVTHWTGSEWENVMGSNVATGTASSGSVTSDYMDDFSPFTEGSSGPANPLPIDLLSFNATCSHDIVDIDFTVISQINNDYFLVERSEDAVNWEVIGNIDGAGNTNTQMDYNFVDANPLASEGYYRLTQMDFDAKSETFWPVTTECSTENTGLNLTLYPNPILDHFTIEIDLDEYQGDDVYYTILDIRGSIVKEEQIYLTRGFNKHKIQLEGFSKGAYMLRFTNTKNHIKEQRIMVK